MFPAPAAEIYGFVLYFGSFFGFLVFLCWALLPEPVLHSLGFTYYPDHWWAVALPAHLTMSIIYILVVYYGYILLKSPSLDDPRTIVDSHSRVGLLRPAIPQQCPPVSAVDLAPHPEAGGSLEHGHGPLPAAGAMMTVPTDPYAPLPALSDIPLSATNRVLFYGGRPPGPLPPVSRA
ncbi:hypothetical protein H696_04717 [Fonticula alba]|uniref:PIG-P domain-containing protein n=1 Tax=Fonticula alba TaxID=691883 RepID=A0A058Z3C9_FONAL|nr:hypothetical protein H696_04717 [Fonticula alba]KCV68423.1 hypothetical protein H696_04717 [Fonticula alba]|eukprot:XP_009496855.1 hypothetical protein H696_04717 [Fonticula alba]